MPMLKPSLLQRDEQAHLTHHVVLEPGTTIEDILKPDFGKALMAHVRRQIESRWTPRMDVLR